jgi:hypothetical protein
MAQEVTMKKIFHFIIFLMVATAILFLAVPVAAQAKQERRHQQHRRNGDIWVGCIVDAPATTWESAFSKALATGNSEDRSCWVNRQKGWWILHWTEKTPVVTVKSDSKESAQSSALFSIHRARSVVQ